MKIKEFIQRYKIVLFLSFLVVLLIILKLRYGQSDNQVVEKVAPTATPTMTFDETYPEEMIEISN